MTTGFSPSSSKASSTAIWASPRAPPAPSARAKVGEEAGSSERGMPGLHGAKLRLSRRADRNIPPQLRLKRPFDFKQSFDTKAAEVLPCASHVISWCEGGSGAVDARRTVVVSVFAALSAGFIAQLVLKGEPAPPQAPAAPVALEMRTGAELLGAHFTEAGYRQRPALSDRVRRRVRPCAGQALSRARGRRMVAGCRSPRLPQRSVRREAFRRSPAAAQAQDHDGGYPAAAAPGLARACAFGA